MLTDKQALKNLATNLAALLKERGWQQVELARRIMQEGETVDAASMRVSRYIRGAHMPSGATLANIAEALSVTIDWLLANHKGRGKRAG